MKLATMCKHLLVVLAVFISIHTLYAVNSGLERFIPSVTQPVLDMQSSYFALGGGNGGLAFFDSSNTLQIIPEAFDLQVRGAIDAMQIDSCAICVLGDQTNNDGIYRYDLPTASWNLIENCFNPHFIKHLSSGYYVGFGAAENGGGLWHSEDGFNWTAMTWFDGKNVVDIEENFDGTLFIAANNDLYMGNGDSFDSEEMIVPISDLYLRGNRLFVACGCGTDSDAVYEVEYDDDEFTNSIFINYFTYPTKLYEYAEYLVVGCNSPSGSLFLMEPVANGNVWGIDDPFGISNVFCFSVGPINTPNFIVGTDIGIFLCTNLNACETSPLSNILANIPLSNYPNPFNPRTTITFSIPTDGNVELSIFNVKGQKIKTLLDNHLANGQHQVVWNGQNAWGQMMSSGVYYYQLRVEGIVKATNQCLLLK